MSFLFHGLLIIASFFAPAAFAQDEIQKAELSRSSKSAAQREGKRFQATAQVGMPVVPYFAGGVSLAYFIDKDSMIDIDYVRGDNSWLFFRAEVKSFGVHYKQFVSNSFYLKAGLDDRQIRLYDGWSLFGAPTGRDFARHEVIAASFAVGNQWQFNKFTLGCDWGGLMVPIAILKQEYDEDNVDPDDRSDASSSNDRASRITLQAVRFYIGMSW